MFSFFKKKAKPKEGEEWITLTPPGNDVLKWITGIRDRYKGYRIAITISDNFNRYFSIVYDFSDLIVIDPDGNGGIASMDISDTVNILDELLSLRLCYEKYTPIYLRLSEATTSDEMDYLLSYCRLSGIDGIVASSARQRDKIHEKTQHRMTVILDKNGGK